MALNKPMLLSGVLLQQALILAAMGRANKKDTMAETTG